jgi:anti-anti-sigma factor
MAIARLLGSTHLPTVQPDPPTIGAEITDDSPVSYEKGRTMTVDLADTSTVSEELEWPFEVTVEAVTDEHAVIRVKGDADMVTSPKLLLAINDATANYSDIVLDLSQVSFLSSAAIDVVFDAYARRPNNFRVFAPVRPARQVLELFADERLLGEVADPIRDVRHSAGLQDNS